MPRFTVICPTYNRSTAILPTLESVRVQSLRDWEMIVVSDASDDDTDAVVTDAASREPRIRLMRTPRFGSQSGPTNLALREAAGELVAYVDHDDRWEPDHLRLLSDALDGGADYVGTRSRTADAAGAVTSTAHPLSLCWHPELQLMSPLFGNSCAGHRAGLAESVGGWRESPVGLEDWDLWLRFADAGLVCATVLDCTVTLLEAPNTRRHSMPCPYRHELARFDDQRGARAARRALTDICNQPAEHAAARKDLTAWYARLADTGGLVFPRGWRGGRAALRGAVESHLRESPPRGADLVIDRHAEGYSLGIVLATMTAEHAGRYSAFARSTMAHQQEYLHDVLPAGSVIM